MCLYVYIDVDIDVDIDIIYAVMLLVLVRYSDCSALWLNFFCLCARTQFILWILDLHDVFLTLGFCYPNIDLLDNYDLWLSLYFDSLEFEAARQDW